MLFKFSQPKKRVWRRHPCMWIRWSDQEAQHDEGEVLSVDLCGKTVDWLKELMTSVCLCLHSGQPLLSCRLQLITIMNKILWLLHTEHTENRGGCCEPHTDPELHTCTCRSHNHRPTEHVEPVGDPQLIKGACCCAMLEINREMCICWSGLSFCDLEAPL